MTFRRVSVFPSSDEKDDIFILGQQQYKWVNVQIYQVSRQDIFLYYYYYYYYYYNFEI